MSSRAIFPLLLAIGGWVAGCGNNDSGGTSNMCPASIDGVSVSLRVATGTLCGTLRVPEGAHTVALLVPGSGPTDREGNSAYGVRTDAYAKLAAVLAARGVASLRYDKRGIGASASAAASESDLRPSDGADDVAGWLAHLKADDRFEKTIVVGHSEGSLLAAQAMQRVPADAFISLAGPGRPMTQVFHDQLARRLSGEPLARADAMLQQLANGAPVANVPPALAYSFRPSVQPYLMELLRYQGAVEVAELAMPTLIAQGTTDVQVTVADARALSAARPRADVLVVDGMCHSLKIASLDEADQTAALIDPSRPLAKALVDGIYAFLDKIVARSIAVK
ncbi:MAG: alpha/beta fold hydrolase [Polyangiaceae bacterium]